MNKTDDDFLWDGSGTPDADVADLQKTLAPLAHNAPLDEVRLARAYRETPITAQEARNSSSRSGRQSPVLLAAAVCSAGLCVAAIVLLVAGGKKDPCRAAVPGFAFTSSSEVSCGSHASVAGNLPVGETITVGRSPMELTIANIGKAQVAAGSAISLITTSAHEHRLALRHGRMHATVVAAPRLFIVETAAATAIDLGCEYDVAIDRAGVGSLTVMTGAVELTSKFGAIVVPAGYSASLAPNQGAGVPILTASKGYLAEIATDIAAGKPIAATRWQAPTDDDTITLAYLLPRLDAASRALVVDLLIGRVPLANADAAKAKAGDLTEIQRWCDALVQQRGAPRVNQSGGKTAAPDESPSDTPSKLAAPGKTAAPSKLATPDESPSDTPSKLAAPGKTAAPGKRAAPVEAPSK